MADREKKRERQIYKKFEYLEKVTLGKVTAKMRGEIKFYSNLNALLKKLS